MALRRSRAPYVCLSCRIASWCCGSRFGCLEKLRLPPPPTPPSKVKSKGSRQTDVRHSVPPSPQEAAPEMEPGTSRTPSETHTPRPSSQNRSLDIITPWLCSCDGRRSPAPAARRRTRGGTRGKRHGLCCIEVQEASIEHVRAPLEACPQGAHCVEVPHPFRMRKALDSIPSVSMSCSEAELHLCVWDLLVSGSCNKTTDHLRE